LTAASSFLDFADRNVNPACASSAQMRLLGAIAGAPPETLGFIP
jgi:hypothetical protein